MIGGVTEIGGLGCCIRFWHVGYGGVVGDLRFEISDLRGEAGGRRSAEGEVSGAAGGRTIAEVCLKMLGAHATLTLVWVAGVLGACVSFRS